MNLITSRIHAKYLLNHFEWEKKRWAQIKHVSVMSTLIKCEIKCDYRFSLAITNHLMGIVHILMWRCKSKIKSGKFLYLHFTIFLRAFRRCQSFQFVRYVYIHTLTFDSLHFSAGFWLKLLSFLSFFMCTTIQFVGCLLFL